MSIDSILKTKGAEVFSILPESSVKATADEMRTKGIAALVVKSDDDVLGIVSEREIVSGFSQFGDKFATMTVKDIMRRDVHPVAPQDHVNRAMALMTRHRVRHLPVVDGSLLVGLVSIGDAVKNRLDDLEAETRVLRDIYIASR